jgi:death-on-curing protein
MIKFTAEKLLHLHKIVTEATGTPSELREISLLESAAESAYMTFDGVELYPSIEEKGARIACSLISNHPFTDGNKRIGVLFLLTFLTLNDFELQCNNDDVIALGLGAASGEMKYDEVLGWIRKHTVKITP